MITSPPPYSTSTNADGQGTYLVDANGKRFALFTSWQDAENFVDSLNTAKKKIESLTEEITKLKNDESEDYLNLVARCERLQEELEIVWYNDSYSFEARLAPLIRKLVTTL